MAVDPTGTRGAPNGRRHAELVFEQLPYGILVLDRQGCVLQGNRAAADALGEEIAGLGPLGPRCCDLFGCGQQGGALAKGCLTELALARRSHLPEIRVDLPADASIGAVWLTASRLDNDEPKVVIHMRPGAPSDRRRRTEPYWLAGPGLRIVSLGATRIESGEGPIGGEWLDHRAGQIFKLLICERGRVVPPDEIAEAIWPSGGRKALTNVRHFIHVLRDRLEPERAKRARSSYVVKRKGGYTINRTLIEIDADGFEAGVKAGLAALEPSEARERLGAALDLYQGDFLADEPYTEWAFPERDRLRDLAGQALRALSEKELKANDLAAAAAHLDRLAEMHPFDSDVHRDAIAVRLRRGQRSDAVRRYAAFRARVLRAFDEEPDFELHDLTR